MARICGQERGRAGGDVPQAGAGKLESNPVPVSELTEAAKKPLEHALLRAIREAGLPEPEREYMFAKCIGRRWRADFCWPDLMIIVEVEGGVWKRGRHVRPWGFEKDAEKYNAAIELGYSLYRYTAKTIKNGNAIKQLKRVLRSSRRPPGQSQNEVEEQSDK